LIYLDDVGDECNCEECQEATTALRGGLDAWLEKRYAAPRAPLSEGPDLDPWEE
jgi:hypothetical protein